MSVDKTVDDGDVSIFNREGVMFYKEEDVLIICQIKPILIGRLDKRGRYRIPLNQDHGQWQPSKRTRKSKKYLQQANSVYDLQSTEESIKWMHAVCGYPVKSTWIKTIRAGIYIRWLMLTERNVARYYPETNETPKGHLRQSRKNVRSNKPKLTPLEVPNKSTLQEQKVHKVYTNVYNVRNTVFSNQTEQLPTLSQQGNKYIMVMVETDSNAILVKPIKSPKDAELTRAYQTMRPRLRRAGIIPKKHILDNKVSEALKTIIQDECKTEMELIPPGTNRRDAVKVAVRNFKAHFLSILAGTAQDFPP